METWEYKKKDDVLIYNLKHKLIEIEPGIKFIPKSYEELVETTEDFREKTDEIAGLMASFIKIAKCNLLYPKDIAKRVKSKKFSRKQRIFGQIALEIYNRYQDFLTAEGKIDFNDMINTAVEIVKKNPQKYLDMYDHVLVDEFQDISYQRLQLINGFVNQDSNTKLFCVGDDFQSIYQFTGSDVTFFTDFEDFFVHPETSLLKTNYRCSHKIVEMSNDLISNNKNQIKKTIYTKNKTGPIPIVFEFTERLTYRQKINKEHMYSLIENLLSNGVKPEDIMVISRFNRNLKELEIHCGAQGVPIEEEVEGKIKRKGMRFYSAHKSKGTEAKHVILMDIISGVYGFPCEIQDSSVFEIAQRFKKKSFIEEERRLFYVALTRCKEFLYVFTIQNNISMFLIEIEPYLKKIFIDSIENWNQILTKFVSNLIQGKLREMEHPIFCQICGSLLKEREEKYGRFLGCTGYPKCKYIYNFVEEHKQFCPICGKPVVEQNGKYGKFLRCIGFPQCKYTYNIKDENDISCPSCGNKLVLRKGKYGKFLGCLGYPQCRFAFNLSKSFRNKNSIFCPKCGKRLALRSGKYGEFLGCFGYPECRFTFDLR
ncbi:ATP-dependent DNA helicase Rep [subsurface metagenome]